MVKKKLTSVRSVRQYDDVTYTVQGTVVKIEESPERYPIRFLTTIINLHDTPYADLHSIALFPPSEEIYRQLQPGVNVVLDIFRTVRGNYEIRSAYVEDQVVANNHPEKYISILKRKEISRLECTLFQSS